LHGDLWRQNILVDQKGNLNGLRDWESLSVGDPHWDFRMIRRWIGWNGLDKLLFLYNCSVNRMCKLEYIKILDKISICNSIKIRQERGLLRHDKPDAIERFEEYKKIWPNNLSEN
jgi:aminoglycoside phosphotransferase (APT) family kinase protein